MSEKKLVFDPDRLFTYLSRGQIHSGQKGLVGDSVSSILSDIQCENYRDKVYVIIDVEGAIRPFRAMKVPEENSSYWEFFYLLTSEELDEQEYVPYTWEDVSDLMGKWYMTDGENGEEYVQQIVNFVKDGDDFRINGRSAQDMLKECRWLDGSPCGRRMSNENSRRNS